MFLSNGTTRTFPVKAAILLCAALVTDLALAAPPTLEIVAVTPAAASISVGQKQSFKATGTFSDGSAHVLGRAASDIAPGNTNTCVMLTSGGVDCWGNNDLGQLGDGSTVNSLIARAVKGISTARAMDLGPGSFGCAVLASGAIKCWGYIPTDGGAMIATRAVRVPGISSATGVAVGEGHGCAVLASGAVRCWGSNIHGELGDGTNAGSGAAVGVTGVDSATAVDVSWGHSCARLASGAVQCWGYGQYGELGNGTTTSSHVPVTVKGISNSTAVATGSGFSCALLASGEVQCWGSGAAYGQLGSGSYTNSSVPVYVAGISTATAITAGSSHVCAVLSGGSAVCWGLNNQGQLGNGSTKVSSSNTPIPVSEITAPVELVAGSGYTCALLSDGAMRCWGSDRQGQLGDRRRTLAPIRWPVNVVGTPGVAWESRDPSKATITGRGLAAGIAIGNTTITATTAGFINDNAVLTVK
jgi:alpha-tubulin suppressor-like RCC1 family protein